MSLFYLIGGRTVDKKFMELETTYRRLESEINELSARKDNLSSVQDILKKELGRIDDRLDLLTKELLFVVREIRK
jgi:chromosome segregation ATPase